MRAILVAAAALALAAPLPAANRQQADRARLDQIEREMKDDVPRLLCLTENLATGGQPTEQSYAKLAAHGFRSVLNLRTAAEGAGAEKERAAVERAGMRYLHIPVASAAPEDEQADEFRRAVSAKENHPMLVHCATANRVGAMMLIYRVVEHGWSEERAEEEAARIGLRSETLRQFARDYLRRRKEKRE